MPSSEELRNAADALMEQMQSLNESAKELNGKQVRSPFKQVKEFHEAYGMPVSDLPTFLDDERLELRWSLIHEEYLEVSEAIDNIKESKTEENMFALLKELADLIYVVEGYAVEMGVDLDKVFERVHESNMSKLDNEGNPVYRSDGKVMKGPNYQPPNFDDIL